MSFFCLLLAHHQNIWLTVWHQTLIYWFKTVAIFTHHDSDQLYDVGNTLGIFAPSAYVSHMNYCQWATTAQYFFAAQYLTEWVKMSYFHQLWLVSGSILPTSNQTQRWNSAVRSHLFEWIIAFISIHYRSIEREMTVVCALPACCVCASLSTNH